MVANDISIVVDPNYKNDVVDLIRNDYESVVNIFSSRARDEIKNKRSFVMLSLSTSLKINSVEAYAIESI